VSVRDTQTDRQTNWAENNGQRFAIGPKGQGRTKEAYFYIA